jgi:hypothetical protein
MLSWPISALLQRRSARISLESAEGAPVSLPERLNCRIGDHIVKRRAFLAGLLSAAAVEAVESQQGTAAKVYLWAAEMRIRYEACL